MTNELQDDMITHELCSFAYICDGDTSGYFLENIGTLAKRSEIELWALAGMFLDRDMIEIRGSLLTTPG